MRHSSRWRSHRVFGKSPCCRGPQGLTADYPARRSRNQITNQGISPRITRMPRMDGGYSAFIRDICVIRGQRIMPMRSSPLACIFRDIVTEGRSKDGRFPSAQYRIADRTSAVGKPPLRRGAGGFAETELWAKRRATDTHFSHADWLSRLSDGRRVGVLAAALSACGLSGRLHPP